MPKLEDINKEKYLFLFPIITAVLVIIATLIPAISVNLKSWPINISGNIYLWSFEDGNIVSSLKALHASSWLSYMLLILMLFTLAIILNVVMKLINLGIKLYKEEETFADNEEKWLTQGILIIIYGITVIVMVSVVFQGVIEDLSLPHDFTLDQFYSIGPGLYLLFVAGAVCFLGFGLGKKFAASSTNTQNSKNTES